MARAAESKGRRGPTKGSVRYLMPRPSVDVVEATDNRRVPRAPSHLGPEGRAAWRAIMRQAPRLVPELDRLAVQRFGELADERVALRAELEKGYTLTEPIVAPTGAVVGDRTVLNPAVTALRQLDRQLDALMDRLGLSPAARAKLGLTLTSAERQQLEVDAVLRGAFKDEDGDE